jgi:transposase
MAVADVAQAPHAAGVSLGTLGTRQGAIDTLRRRLQSTSPQLVFVSAAGPCGSWLSRSRTQTGHVGWGVAPSLRPKQPGARVPTPRRDALTLARLRRAGDLPPVSVPAVEDAALRDLGRARAEALRARQTATCRLHAFLLRHASRDTGRATWGPAHLRWRSAVVCRTPAPPSVLHADVRAGTAPTARLARLAPERPAQGQAWRLAPVVDTLQALRGGPGPVAVTPGAARGARTRCAPPRQLLHSLGCTPSADATGARRRQGGRTQTGNRQARRALVDGAWASRSPATVSRPLQRRLEKGAKPLHESRGKAQRRWCQRDRALSTRGKQAHQVVVAIARALRALMGAMAGSTDAIARAPCQPRSRCPAVVSVHGQRRSPGVVHPAMACRGGKQPAGQERGRPPTDARKVGAHPRLAAGSTVVSSWLRLCRGTQYKRTKKMPKNR